MRLAGKRTRATGIGTVVASTVFFAAVGPASAQRAGSFTCEATVLRVFSSEFFAANPQNEPCRSDRAAGVSQFVPIGTLGFVAVLAPEAVTKSNPEPTAEGTAPARGHGAGAQSGVAGLRLRLGPVDITAAALRTRVVETCGPPSSTAPPPDMRGDDNLSDTVFLSVNGTTFSVDQPATIPVGPFTVYIQREVRTENSLTRRALEIEQNGESILVVGESTVDFTGNPCRPA